MRIVKKYFWTLAAATFILAAGSANAAIITWSAAQTISGVADVSLEGTLVRAYSSVAATVNTVPFTASWAGTGPTSSGAYRIYTTGVDTFSSPTFWMNNNTSSFNTGSNPYNLLPANYKSLLSGAVYVDHPETGTYSIGSLTNGQSYLVQLWFTDPRGATNRPQILDGIASMSPNTTNVAGGLGQYIIGRFTADAGTQSFTILTTASGVEQINAIQLRAVPEPSSLAMMLFGSVGLWLMRRKQTR